MSPRIKRVFIIGSVIVISVFCIWLAYKYKVSSENTYTAEHTAQQSLVVLGNSVSEIDVDSDGLKDWEEVLWGSDRHNTDTDKDGTKDGDEVKLSRNPLVKGPHDALSTYPMGTNTATNETITTTDRFSRELFSRYSALKSQVGTVNTEHQQKLVADIIKEAESLVERPPAYGIQSLSLIKTPSTIQIQTYTNNVRNVLLKERGDTGNEIAILAEIVGNRNTTDIKKLDTISAYYEKTARALLQIAVPSQIAEHHIAVVNIYFALSKNTEAFKFALTDPFIASANFSDYTKNNQLLSEYIMMIQTYVEKMGFSLSS